MKKKGIKEKASQQTAGQQRQNRGGSKKGPELCLRAWEARHTDTHSSFGPTRRHVISSSLAQSTAWPLSESQVLRVKQREGPILSEERFNAAHLTGDQFLLHWGACEKMSEARNGAWERELAELGSPAYEALGICLYCIHFGSVKE